MVQFWLLLGQSAYLFFKSDTVNFVWKTDDEGEAESIILLILMLFFLALSQLNLLQAFFTIIFNNWEEKVIR